MKIGKNARDIFAPTSSPEAISASKPLNRVEKAVKTLAAPENQGQNRGNGRGRPVVHQEPATKITTVLLNRHVVYLDGVSNSIRQSSGAVVKRSEILRALVEALEEAAPDLSAVKSQADLTGQLKERLRR